MGTIQSPPYIQKVHQDSTGALTTFDGMFADIFKQLKVKSTKESRTLQKQRNIEISAGHYELHVYPCTAS